MWVVIALLAIIKSSILVALFATPRLGKLAATIALVACAVPAVVDDAIVRLHLSMLAGLTIMRVTDLLVTRDWTPSWPRRLGHVLSYVDTRELRAATRRLLPAHLVALVLYAAMGFCGLGFALLWAPTLGDHVFGLAMRWLGGAIAIYALVDGVAHGLNAAYRLGGASLPPIHDHPVLARSVGEFWSRRWNLPVSRFLHRQVFVPIARRGHRGRALLVAFAASGIAHAFLLGFALESLTWAASMLTFFVAQPLVIASERSLRISQRPRLVAHAWTIGSLLLLSPLFTEPSLRVIETLL